jgi:hypothetical protein
MLPTKWTMGGCGAALMTTSLGAKKAILARRTQRLRKGR